MVAVLLVLGGKWKLLNSNSEVKTINIAFQSLKETLWPFIAVSI